MATIAGREQQQVERATALTTDSGWREVAQTALVLVQRFA